MKSFPIRIEPLKSANTGENNFRNCPIKLKNKSKLQGSTYDFNPFPYWPMWVDSGNRLLDLPNWITCVASPIQISFNVITAGHKLFDVCKLSGLSYENYFCRFISASIVVLTGVHSSAIVEKTEHKTTSQVWSLFLLTTTEKNSN